MSSEIKVVLFLLTISALLGFTQVPIQYAEGAVSWNGFLREVGFGDPQVYEVSAVSIIPANEIFGNKVEVRCLDGDRFLKLTPNLVMTFDPAIKENFNIGIERTDTTDIFKQIPGTFQNSILIGQSMTPRNVGAEKPPFDIPVTVTGVCISPSSFMSVGGEWQATDTTALIIGYSVLNAYWIAPIGIGIGVGIYLVKRKF